VAICALACCFGCRAQAEEADQTLLGIDAALRSGAYDSQFTGDLRNTVAHLDACQQDLALEQIPELGGAADSVAASVSELVERHYDAAEHGIDPREPDADWPGAEAYRESFERVEDELTRILGTHPGLVQVDLMVDPYLTYMAVRKEIGEVALGPDPDLHFQVPDLRGQIGFYPEPYGQVLSRPTSPLPYFAYSKGPVLHLRVPVIHAGKYLCDLSAFYYNLGFRGEGSPAPE
jgi:hypothetical protein